MIDCCKGQLVSICSASNAYAYSQVPECIIHRCEGRSRFGVSKFGGKHWGRAGCNRDSETDEKSGGHIHARYSWFSKLEGVTGRVLTVDAGRLDNG